MVDKSKKLQDMDLKELIPLYTDSWYKGLKKSFSGPLNKTAFRNSYEIVARKAVEEYREGLKGEKEGTK